MNQNMDELIKELNGIFGYVQYFKTVFGSSGISPENIGKAISTFERSVVSKNSAFDKYLSNKLLINIREPRMKVSQAIIAIKKCGGIPIWAHPNIKDMNFEKNLREFIELGLAGIEVSSPRYGLNRQEIIIKLCSKYNLLLSD